MPEGEKRPADVVAAAAMVAKITTGEIEDDGKNKAALVLGRKSGKPSASGRRARAASAGSISRLSLAAWTTSAVTTSKQQDIQGSGPRILTNKRKIAFRSLTY